MKYNKEINKKILAAILIIGIGAPFINVLYDFIPMPILSAILALCAAALILYIYDRLHNTSVHTSAVETCSDIKNICFNLSEGNFVIRAGDSFELEASSVKSRITNETWYINSCIKHDENGAVTIINLPEEFTFGNAFIHLYSGNVLIENLNAASSLIDVRTGSIEAKKLLTQSLDIKCGSGNIDMNVSVHGSADIECGSGKVILKLANSEDDFGINAVSGSGTVTVGSREIHGVNQQLKLNESAPYKLNAKCGAGNVSVSFC